MPRRPTVVAAAAIVTGCALVGCGDDGPTPRGAAARHDVVVVEVAAQPCTRPTRDRGLGVVVGPDLVATAAHTVEGARREITVDGAPARVVAHDVRRDLALLATATGDAAAATFDDRSPTDAVVMTPAGTLPVRVVRTGTLRVTNVSDGTRTERMVHTFEPGVVAGTSGAPLVTPDGAVAGIVVLDRGGATRADGVTAAELAGLLAEHAANGDRKRTAAPRGCLG